MTSSTNWVVERAVELEAERHHLEASGPGTVRCIADSGTMAVLLPAADSASTTAMPVGIWSMWSRSRPGDQLQSRVGPVSVDAHGDRAYLSQDRLTPQGDRSLDVQRRLRTGLQGRSDDRHRAPADLVVLDARDERELAWVIAPPTPLIIGNGEIVQFLADAGESEMDE